MSKALRFVQITAKHQDFPFLTVFLIIKTSFQNISITLLRFCLNFTNIEATVLEKKAPVNDFVRFQMPRIIAEVKQVMASFRCYDNSDVIATLIITNFHLYLIQLWWQFFQMFVYGDVVYAQTWQLLTLKNCIEPLHMPVRPMLLHRMALFFVRLFCKNMGKL